MWSAVRGVVPGLRAIFVASLLLQLTFQTFTTWFALHGTERFGVRPEDVTTGFIAWAIGGVIGALPAGMIGVRIGRRNAMLLGFGLMAACLAALHRVTGVSQATPLLALASACWTLPMVNAFPLFVEPVPRQHRGVLAALYLLSMALGGAIGDPLNGAVFDLFGSYRPLFLMMTGYTAAGVRRGAPRPAGSRRSRHRPGRGISGSSVHRAFHRQARRGPRERQKGSELNVANLVSKTPQRAPKLDRNAAALTHPRPRSSFPKRLWGVHLTPAGRTKGRRSCRRVANLHL